MCAVTDICFDAIKVARDSIDSELRKKLLARKGAKTPAAKLARKLLSDPVKFSSLVSDLATIGVMYKVGSKPVTFDANGPPYFLSAPPKKGAPRKPETSVLLYDVRAALIAATGAKLGVWQNDGDMAEGLIVEIARIVAISVGRPLTAHLRTVAGNSRKITPTFSSYFLDRSEP